MYQKILIHDTKYMLLVFWEGVIDNECKNEIVFYTTCDDA